MAIVESHESPDRVLRLYVDLTDDDWTIGFEGCAGHTHGNTLEAWGYTGGADEMVQLFVRDILSSRREICVYRIDGIISDVAIPGICDERPLQRKFAKYASPNETMEIRFWDGRVVVE